MPRRLHAPLRRASIAGAFVILLTTGQASGQEPAGRFSMTPTDGGGFIRLDTQTGAMALCSGKEGEWACKAMPDDQKSLNDRIAKLEEENRSLRDENKRLEDVLGLNPDAKPKDGAGAVPGAPQDGGPPVPPEQGLKLPSEKDVDKAFDYVEGILKKFRDRLKKLEEEDKRGGGAVPL
ncbi:MAG: hypothetical protein KDJ47_18500 [Hyphomicrobiaceae bacterium]|nr:hypothetical protein [Hyphomicrobiaceae bacterium]